MWKLPDQGSNPSHSSKPSHSSEKCQILNPLKEPPGKFLNYFFFMVSLLPLHICCVLTSGCYWILPVSELSLMQTLRERGEEEVIGSLRAGRNQMLLNPTLSFTDDETDLEEKRATKS